MGSNDDVLETASSIDDDSDSDSSLPPPPVSFVFVPNDRSGRETLREQGYGYDKTANSKKSFVSGPPPRTGYWDDETIESCDSNEHDEIQQVSRATTKKEKKEEALAELFVAN